MVGNGLQGSLLGVRAAQEGFGNNTTGLVMAAFFTGFLAGSLWTPNAVRRVGHIRVFAALASFASISILVHALIVEPVAWGVMRFLTGFCYAGIFVVAESWLNDRTGNEGRGQLLGIYMLTMFIGMGGGQIMLNVADPASSDLFIMASAIISFSVLPLLLSATPAPEIRAPHPVGLARLYRASPLGTIGTFAAGIINGTVFGMGAVYAHASGLDVRQISLFMSALIIGAALLQWPVGKLSDHFDRRLVITAVTLLAAAAALIAEQAAGTHWPFLLAVACSGGLSMSVHPLSIAYTNDYLSPEEMVSASSALVLVLGVGSVIGPLVTGILLGSVGPSGFFWWIAAIHFALALFAVWRMTRRAALPNEEQGSYTLAPVQSVPFAEAIAQDEVEAEGESANADTTCDKPRH